MKLQLINAGLIWSLLSFSSLDEKLPEKLPEKMSGFHNLRQYGTQTLRSLSTNDTSQVKCRQQNY